MNTMPPAEIASQLSSVLAMLERHLAGILQAVHLFGSAVDGGLKPHSDIDLLVTVSEPPRPPVRGALMSDLLSVSAWPGASSTYRALEVTVVVYGDVVPWCYPPRRELQFGEWLREAIQAGAIEPAAEDPDLAILLTKARQHSVCLLGTPAHDWFSPVPAADLAQALAHTAAQWNEARDWEGDERNVVLALARVWFSLSTGRIASKDVAAAWALERLPAEHREVLAAAKAAYLGAGPDDLADRAERVAAYVQYVRSVARGR